MDTPFLQSILTHAETYLERNWCVVPLAPHRKKPIHDDWPNLRLTKEDLHDYFAPENNLGIMCGAPSKIIDIDLDVSGLNPQRVAEVVIEFLGPTDLIHEHKSNPLSHFWYHSSEPFPEYHKFLDPVGDAGLVEVRSTGHQTMAPPSIYPEDDEQVYWVKFGKGGDWGRGVFPGGVNILAAALLLARHWPQKGSKRRHDCALALAGLLLRRSWPERLTRIFIGKVAYLGNDEEWQARMNDARTTDRRLAQEQAATGRRTLIEKLGDCGARVVAALEKFCQLPAINSRPVMVLDAPSAYDFLAQKLQEEERWLIEGLVQPETQAYVNGRPKVGKSHTILQWAVDSSHGLPVFGNFKVPSALRVLFVELEEPPPLIRKRLREMLQAYQVEANGNLLFFTKEELRRYKLHSYELLHAHLEAFMRLIKDKGVQLLFIIALRSVFGSENLNDSDACERFNYGLDQLLEFTRVALYLAHHERKSPASTVEAQGLGSTMLAARADAVFSMSRMQDRTIRRVRTQARYATPERFCLRLVAEGTGRRIVMAADPEDEQRTTLVDRLVRGGTMREAAKAARVPETTARRWAEEEGF